MNRIEYLSNWDRKDTEYLKTFSDKNKNSEKFVQELIELIGDSGTQSAATWILKNEFSGIEFSNEQSESILNLLDKLTYWDSQLHVLQFLHQLKISESKKKELEVFLRKSLVSDNKFVRAWAYNGFDVLAERFTEYRQEVDQFLEMGLRDEPASVKARIRNILKNRK
ncbi:MAG: hypothetical protein OQJ89_09735 [Kangiellaceae bacterium]|nr:hypothetical protein [Kangiellaceae bacterium]MCW9017235.1 hypothetical protein [Kangiellaceae bacterium]